MNPIFKHGPSEQHRLVLVLFCSVLLIFFDHKMASFEPVRGYLQSLVSPIQYLATAPRQFLAWTSENLKTRKQLVSQNQEYQTQLLNLREHLLELDIIKKENDRLRSLLASPLRTDTKKMVAEILSVNSDPYGHKIVINRGTNDGVYEGQPVLDDKGIVGQILHVGTTTSRVILISDVTHAVPVRIARNGIRLIATGTGRIDQLNLNHVPHSTDIQTGDILVTSGLGGKYPEGYPVAEVSFVAQNETRPFAKVLSKPVAEIDRIRYLLLLWPSSEESLFSPKAQLDNAKESSDAGS